LHDFRADAFVGEDFQQQAVREASVDEVDALHAFVEGADGAVHFRAHAFVDDAAFFEFVHLRNF
jgi:hypothetical protein